MGTVCVKRWVASCVVCGFRKEFMTGDNAGSVDAEKIGASLHAAVTPTCGTGKRVVVKRDSTHD